jgi:hypothetical protein
VVRVKPLLFWVVAAVVVVAVVASVLVIGPIVDPAGWNGGGPGARAGWNTGFNGCCFDDGIPNAAVMTPPVIPTGTPTFYVAGSLSISGWTHWNGVTNDTGSCAPATGPAGACDAYVGIWTPAAWSAYAAGGPMQPFWCYTESGSGCVDVSSASFTTPSLVALEGQPWDIVIWNSQTYGLIGAYSFTTYVSPDFWSV